MSVLSLIGFLLTWLEMLIVYFLFVNEKRKKRKKKIAAISIFIGIICLVISSMKYYSYYKEINKAKEIKTESELIIYFDKIEAEIFFQNGKSKPLTQSSNVPKNIKIISLNDGNQEIDYEIVDNSVRVSKIHNGNYNLIIKDDTYQEYNEVFLLTKDSLQVINDKKIWSYNAYLYPIEYKECSRTLFMTLYDKEGNYLSNESVQIVDKNGNYYNLQTNSMGRFCYNMNAYSSYKFYIYLPKKNLTKSIDFSQFHNNQEVSIII